MKFTEFHVSIKDKVKNCMLSFLAVDSVEVLISESIKRNIKKLYQN